MLVIWIGLIFGTLLQICSCDSNKTSWSTQKIGSDLTSLEDNVNTSNRNIKNLQAVSEDIKSLQVVQESPKAENNTSNENSVLVKRDTEQVDVYNSFGGDQYTDFNQYQFDTKGNNFRDKIGYQGDLGEDILAKDLDEKNYAGERILPKDLDDVLAMEKNAGGKVSPKYLYGLTLDGGGRLTAGLAPFYQPAGRSYLGELSHKVSKLFGGGESVDYYEKPFGSPNNNFQRHVENLNNELMFRDVVEGNHAQVQKDVNSAESDMIASFQEKMNNDYNDIDDGWLSSMASDQSIVDDGQSFNILNDGKNFDVSNPVKESKYNDDNNGFQKPGKSDEMLFDNHEITGGLLEGNGINTGNINFIPHESGESGNVLSNFEKSVLTPEGNHYGSYISGGNNKKRDVNISENSSDDEKSENINSDNSSEDQKIGGILDSNQNLSFGNSQDTASIVSSSNDVASNEKGISDGNLGLGSQPKNKHRRNGKPRFKKKIQSKIVNKQNILPLKMDDSFHEQSPPISSIDNGGGILLKDLDFQNENKIPNSNEDKDSSQSLPASTNGVRNKDKNLVSNGKGSILIGDSSTNSSFVAVDAVSSSNSENEAKFSQNSLGESILESIDGVKTLKLSSVNFKADDSNELNLSSGQSNSDTKPEIKQKLHNAASRYPIKLSHKNKNKKIKSLKGRIVSSYSRSGLFKTTTVTPGSTLDSRDRTLLNKNFFIHDKDRPTKRKQSNASKKGFKSSKEEDLDGFYLYDTSTKAKKVHNIKKNDNKHKPGISNTKMVKVKLSVSPCQFNKDKYLINNKSASKSNLPKNLSSRSVKQDQKQLNTSVEGTKSNATTSKIASGGKFDATTKKLLKQEKTSVTEPSKGKKPVNDLENPNFFDKTLLPATTIPQKTSNNGQEGSQTNKEANKKSETKVLPQTEINDFQSTTTRKSDLVLMNYHSARKNSNKKHNSASLNEDDACDEDDNEYSEDCGKTTKSVCKTTKSECSTTESQSKSNKKDGDICDPLDYEENVETEGPCEPEEDASESTKVPCVTSEKVCGTTEEICGTTQEPCATTEDIYGTTDVACETTASTCVTTEAPCDTTAVSCEATETPSETAKTTSETTKAPCETTEEICGTTLAPCETEAPTETTAAPSIKTDAPGDTTETPCDTTEDICGTTQAPCETTEDICRTTQAPCETTEDISGTTQEPCVTATEAASETTEAASETTETPSETARTTSETTKAPCETTEDISETTQAPCETSEAPCGTTQASRETTKNPCTTPPMSSSPPDENSECDEEEEEEEEETDPPCQTTKVYKTAYKKGNNTSGERNEYVDAEDDDVDDEYDYENE